MKRITSLLLIIAGLVGGFALLAGGCGRQDVPGRKVIKVASVLPDTHPSGAALTFFKQKLEELSGGQMSAQIFFNGKIGDPYNTLEQCQNGLLDITHVSTANITRMAFMANVLAMPFIWHDTDHQHRVLDGEVGEAIRNEVKPYDVAILGYFDAGTRNVTTRKGPVTRPDDLANMKIRVMDAPLMIETINALGAQAIPLKQDEVYHALETGLLDGWENNSNTVLAFKMYETGCKYYACTRHFSIPDVLVAGGPFLKELTAQQRKWLDAAVAQTVVKQRQLWEESEQQVLKTLAERGMVMNDVDLDAFRARVKPIYDKYSEERGPEFKGLVDKIQAAFTAPASAPATAVAGDAR